MKNCDSLALGLSHANYSIRGKARRESLRLRNNFPIDSTLKFPWHTAPLRKGNLLQQYISPSPTWVVKSLRIRSHTAFLLFWSLLTFSLLSSSPSFIAKLAQNTSQHQFHAPGLKHHSSIVTTRIPSRRYLRRRPSISLIPRLLWLTRIEHWIRRALSKRCDRLRSIRRRDRRRLMRGRRRLRILLL